MADEAPYADNNPAASDPSNPVDKVLRVDEWEDTIKRVVPSIVAIRFQSVRFFDTYPTCFASATGFVVDKTLGIILTNRHVVRPGPVTALAVFSNHEEVPIFPLYRDPVHDFGFFRFDPAALKFLPLSEIKLAPERARVGISIRVVGNDAGEKLSILQSTLARLDRKAPEYGVESFNDFNTFYYQAASGTSGGSSGSPVLDVDGMAIALNAGGKKGAASSFYLPLDRVVRALGFIQRKEPVARGSLQTVFEHENYDECRRLGLPQDDEVRFRETFPDGSGLLVVDKIVPRGPADNLLEHGDIVMAVNGRTLNDFLTMEEIIDNSVGNSVSFTVSRCGTRTTIDVRVQDLAETMPDSFLEFGGGVYHPMSLHVAINRMFPVGGVYCVYNGYTLARANIPSATVIMGVGKEVTNTVEDFERQIAALAHGQRIAIRYCEAADMNLELVKVVTIDRHWFGFRRWKRNDESGLWIATDLPPPPAAAVLEPATTTFPFEGNEVVGRLAPSLCMVDVDVPFLLSGAMTKKFHRTGIVVDAAKGFVVVDRNTVSVGICDIRITFANSIDVPGKIAFLHPLHNFAILQYDPALLGTSQVRSVEFCDTPLQQGEMTWFVGLTSEANIVSRQSLVTRKEQLGFIPPKLPRFRQVNMEAYCLDTALPSVGGVLCRADGKIQAMWASFSRNDTKNTLAEKDISEIYRGLPVQYIADVVNPMREGRDPQLRSLELELWTVSLSNARARGLPQSWVSALESKSARHQALYVVRTVAGSPADGLITEGDLLLAVNGTPVTTFRECETATQHEATAELTIWRNSGELKVIVPTVPVDPTDVTRFCIFAGAFLQESYRELRLQMKKVPEGVYCGRYLLGSPANQYGLTGRTWIQQINGVRITDLDSLLTVVNAIPDAATVRLQMVDADRKTHVVTLRVNYHYWPTGEFRNDGTGWRIVKEQNLPSVG